MLKKYLIVFASVVVLLIVVLVVIVALQPSTFHVERSTTIDAPPAEVFPEVNNLRRSQEWSPWSDLDPDMEVVYEGPAEGVGASYSWDGNREVGTGSMTITESRPNEYVQSRLKFVEPFEDACDVEWTLKPSNDQTQITWSMHGENNFIAKAVCLFMNMDMDKEIGEKFEKGLASLKTLVEEREEESERPTVETGVESEKAESDKEE